ncbi:MAG: T9SS type A sorting domain-containing protein [Bacteroidales bacterium]|nr:T9SS type A sorting domain-containing protein [Bacteroidales bacterium]
MDYQSATYSDDGFYIEAIPPAPETISGDNEVCNGTTFSHYSIPEISNADTYTWHLTDEEAGLLSPSGISATIFWDSEFDGETVLTATATNMCGTGDSAQKNITVTNTVITDVMINVDPGSSCEGDTITITAFGTNGGNNPVYDWYINDNLHYIHQPVITRTDFEDGDEIYCIFTSSSECAANNPAQSETIELDLDPLPAEPAPITGPDEICITVPVSYYTTTGAQNADDYVWTVIPEGTGEVISDGNNAEVHWNTETHGPAYLNVKGINNCGAGPVRQKTTVREYCTDITSIKPASVKVYPNPTKNSLTIAVPTIPAEAAYRLSNLQGLTIKTGLLTDRNTVVDLTSLRRGAYIIQITLGDQIFYHKVIKQ